ncbi:MAG: 5-formyltetrahydrofolate cyclo-ligase [Gammaproteobacteria bacterium]|nr:5-formyltetrahydrofolate cyclo-ligase [Gammaproteobacteria bacterium]MDH3371609.1 5-formyltetrahydrofolate cyclo-ligase [Gammaproteobacteria bacterium]MDH3562055.1 5-formyltetrahydrofolate cyclo-ligase [Gammaproteobacteria bacterium]MDH5487065.1 5-formyltetrahydrofolate cyclo-ligase [Gammaproteobacteria bacterium]
MPTDKNTLRQKLRARRRALSTEEQKEAASRLATNVTGSRLFLASRRIACYLPNDGEIDTHPILAHIRLMQKDCYLPVLSRLSHDRLWFARMETDTKLHPNRFGIPEPVVPSRDLVRAQELDLILMPLVGFDDHGHRLGMGGGYYDRSLEFLRHRHHWRKPHLLGIAYDFQRVNGLTADPWDISLASVITDQAVYLFD